MQHIRKYFLEDCVYEGDDPEVIVLIEEEKKMYCDLVSEGLHKVKHLDEYCYDYFYDVFVVYKDVIRNNILFVQRSSADESDINVANTAGGFLTWLEESGNMAYCDAWGVICRDMIHENHTIHVIINFVGLSKEFYQFDMGEQGVYINTPEEEIINAFRIG